jgi:hypothetical protein
MEVTNFTEQSPYWKANRRSTSYEIASFYGNQRFVAVITKALIESMCNILNLRRGVVRFSPNPQAGGSPLVGSPRLINQVTLHICRTSLPSAT